MYSHLIFDLDGTLIDSLPGIATALNTALEQCHLPTHSIEEIRTFIGDGSLTLCKRSTPDADESTLQKLHDAFLAQYPQAWKNGTSLFDGITEALKEFAQRGYKLSVLSNKPHAFTTEIVDHFFPKGLFDLVLGQREGIAKKPDPSGVHEILGELEQSSANSLLIGDSTIDIVTARNAGIHSLAVTWGYHDKAQLSAVSPTHIVSSATELLSILTPQSSPAFRQPV